MANPVEVTDVEARWKPLSAAKKTVAQAYLDDAWALLTEVELPDLESDLAAEPPTVSLALVKKVVCAAVLRVLKNLNGWSEAEIDDFKRKMGDSATGVLEFYPDELDQLTPSRSDASDAFTILPYSTEEVV